MKKFDPALRLLCAFVCLITSASALAGVRYVSTTGSDSNDGLTPGSPKRTIQAALNASSAPDEVRVSAGTYSESITINRAIQLLGGYRPGFSSRASSAYTTTISGGGSSPVIQVTAANAAEAHTIDGFVIRNGNCGVYANTASVTVSNNRILNNSGFGTGGILVNSSTIAVNAQIINNVISGNTGTGIGGGIFLWLSGGGGTISGNTISGNVSSSHGGGIALVLGTYLVENNLVSSNTSGAYGGGIILNTATGDIVGNRIVGNSAAANSGGLEYGSGSGLIANNLVQGNSASQYGGGMTVFGNDNIRVYNNTVVQNSTTLGVGGISVYSAPAGLVSHPDIRNNIVAFNGSYGIYQTPGSGSTLSHNCFYGNADGNYAVVTPGAGDIVKKPLFADPANGNFRLERDSLCRDAGDDSAVMDITTDLDGQSRSQGDHVDIGAYERATEGRLLFLDTANIPPTAGEAGWDINYQYTYPGRQLGLFAPLTYIEDTDTDTGLPVYYPYMTQVNNGDRQTLSLAVWPLHPDWPRPNTSIAPAHNFTESGDFSVSCDITPQTPLSACSDHWGSITFGTAARVTGGNYGSSTRGGPFAASGTGVLIRTNGMAEVFDNGVQLAVIDVSGLGDYSNGSYHVSFEVHTNPAFNGTGSTHWRLFIGGTMVYEFTRSAGYTGNFVTLSTYSNPALSNPAPGNEVHGDLYDNLRIEEIDIIAPTVTPLFSPAPTVSGWNNTDVIVSLLASDNTGGSGVREVSYSLDGGSSWTSVGGTASFPIVADGNSTFLYRATDNAGNQSAPQSSTVRIDRIVPVTTASYSDVSSGAQVTLYPTDDSSGISASYYRIDSGTLQTYSGPFVVTSPGSHTITFYSVDNAGNVESPSTLGIVVRTSVTITVVGVSGPAGTKMNVSSTLKRNDTNAGIGSKTVTYLLDGIVQGTKITNVSGNTTFLLTIPDTLGSHALTVEFAGDSTFQPGLGSANVIATAPVLSTFTVLPASVNGGSSSTGTVKLSAPAPSDTVVTLGNTNSAATVPATVTVLSGSNTATFNIPTSVVASDTTGTLSATLDSITKTAPLTVKASLLSSVTLAPASLTGGANSTGTVNLSGPAISDTVVSLSSSSGSATVPTTVTILAGNSSATFSVTTTPVSSDTSSTITATLDATSKTATLTIKAAVLMSLTVAPSSVTGGGTATGTVRLTGAAIADTVVTLGYTNSAGTLPPTVTIPAGQTMATFAITTTVVASDVTGTVSATLGAVTKTASFTIKASLLASITLAPANLVGGATSTGTVNLSGAASADTVVSLSSANGAATVPPTVTILMGATSATFSIATSPVSADTPVVITATLDTTSKTATLTVKAASLNSISAAPATVTGGATSTGTVKLSGVAAVDTVVSVSSGNAAASVPATVTVPAGSNQVTFSIDTTPVASDTTVTLTATLGAVTRTGNLNVKAPVLSTIALAPNSVTGGTDITATVTLNGVAAADTVVNLSSANSAVIVPASVTVPAGSANVSVALSTTPVTSNTTGAITATLGAVTKSANATVKAPTFTTFTLTPNPVTGGNDVTAVATMSGPVAVDTVVTLTNLNAKAVLPGPTVTIPAGASSISFTITTLPTASNVNGAVRAVIGATTKSVTLTVKP